MLRIVSVALAGLMMLCFGCKEPQETPGPPPTGGPAEQEAEQTETPAAGEGEEESEPDEFPVADDTAMGGGESPEATDTEPSAESDACPDAREPSGMCAQVITWAKNPETGTCCEYPTPCHAPKNWKTFSSQDDCKK